MSIPVLPVHGTKEAQKFGCTCPETNSQLSPETEYGVNNSKTYSNCLIVRATCPVHGWEKNNEPNT